MKRPAQAMMVVLHLLNPDQAATVAVLLDAVAPTTRIIVFAKII